MSKRFFNVAIPCVTGGICGGFHLGYLWSGVLGASVGVVWVTTELIMRRHKLDP